MAHEAASRRAGELRGRREAAAGVVAALPRTGGGIHRRGPDATVAIEALKAGARRRPAGSSDIAADLGDAVRGAGPPRRCDRRVRAACSSAIRTTSCGQQPRDAARDEPDRCGEPRAGREAGRRASRNPTTRRSSTPTAGCSTSAAATPMPLRRCRRPSPRCRRRRRSTITSAWRSSRPGKTADARKNLEAAVKGDQIYPGKDEAKAAIAAM